MRRLFTVLGIGLLITFAVSGRWLVRYNPALAADPGLRFTLRGHHIYILFAGLLVLLVGQYFEEHTVRWVRYGQYAAAALLIGSSITIAATYFVHSPDPTNRWLANRAIKAFAWGVVLLSITAPRPR